ncbi:MAG: enoyl-CoA hydratase-related protein [Bacteroidota bacterium]|nr:enoyl-CoA hydratase-related protein [Bacteroidota bacterium]
MNYKTIEFELKNNVGTIWLNRPKVHNAFNNEMLSEVIDCVENANNNKDVVCVVIRGRDKSFCAGADLNWMRDVAQNSYEENYKESLNLSKCFYTIYTCKKPTIALVHGVAIGGANGLLAACDMAYCTNDATFSLSEVKIGIIPACVSPYVVKRTGEFGSKELMLTGKRIKGKEAESYRLVNKSLEANEIESYVESVIKLLKTSGPVSMTQCKDLLFEVSNNLSLDEAYKYTAKMIADIRASEEGQEGMAAFLEKRKPNWVKE